MPAHQSGAVEKNELQIVCNSNFPDVFFSGIKNELQKKLCDLCVRSGVFMNILNLILNLILLFPLLIVLSAGIFLFLFLVVWFLVGVFLLVNEFSNKEGTLL